MKIFEITTPGIRLADEDEDRAWNTGGLINKLREAFFEANLALNLLHDFRPPPQPDLTLEAFREKTRRLREIREEVEGEIGAGDCMKEWVARSFETDVRFKRERWAAGAVPLEFWSNTPFLHAKSFIYALDNFDRFLEVLAKTEGVPPGVADHHAKIKELFPDLRGVRNSSHHMEDRARGLIRAAAGNKPDRPLDLKPVNSGMIQSESPVLVLKSFDGSRIGMTMEDGHFGEVDVSEESMAALQSVLQAVIDEFRWRGPRMHYPTCH